jgi:hypothetical protein
LFIAERPAIPAFFASSYNARLDFMASASGEGSPPASARMVVDRRT